MNAGEALRRFGAVMGAVIAAFGIYLPFDAVGITVIQAIGFPLGGIIAGALVYWVFSGFAVPKR